MTNPPSDHPTNLSLTPLRYFALLFFISIAVKTLFEKSSTSWETHSIAPLTDLLVFPLVFSLAMALEYWFRHRNRPGS